MEADREARRQRCHALQTALRANRVLTVAANRAPVTLDRTDDGTLRVQRGGGLVTALADLCRHPEDTTWMACARTEADADWHEGQVSLDGGTAIRMHLLSPDEAAYVGLRISASHAG